MTAEEILAKLDAGEKVTISHELGDYVIDPSCAAEFRRLIEGIRSGEIQVKPGYSESPCFPPAGRPKYRDVSVGISSRPYNA